MGSDRDQNGSFFLRAYRGDFKTLLAWNFASANDAKNLAGFSLQCQPPGKNPYYVYNFLTFKDPAAHARVAGEPDRSSANAPFHKFRWVHVPGLDHQGLAPASGKYTYTVTPRHFDGNGHLTALDAAKSTKVAIEVGPFVKDGLQVAFTRGYVQSQAFVNHFSEKAKFQPNDRTLIFDASQQAGTTKAGVKFSYADEYKWSGFTAREAIFAFLKDAMDKNRRLDAFAYDLNEPGVIAALTEFAKAGRLRLILDDAGLHHAAAPKDKWEDKAEAHLNAAGAGSVMRGKFGSYSHDKVFISYDGDKPLKVLTGSTNFAVTGMYVNSNHVLVYDNSGVAEFYAGVFEQSWKGNVQVGAFNGSKWATQSFVSTTGPNSEFNFSPHTMADAKKVLNGIAGRIAAESVKPKAKRSVLFAVMRTGGVTSPVLEALEAIHARTDVFSFGISDEPSGIFLYPSDKATGVLVTGKPAKSKMPPPFSQVPGVGIGHQVHHKFVVCGFNGPDPVVFCGSSNLALNPETKNGDNLIAIRDGDVATVFAIEALALVDHFNFLNRLAEEAAKKNKVVGVEPSKTEAAAQAEWHLSTTDAWAKPYFDPNDLHSVDRVLFGS
jgi:hypothetical protein